MDIKEKNCIALDTRGYFYDGYNKQCNGKLNAISECELTIKNSAFILLHALLKHSNFTELIHHITRKQ